MFRSKWEVFLVILLLMIFAAGLGMALYPHVQGAIVDHHIAQEAEEFLDWLSGEDADPEPDILVIPGTTEEAQPRPYSDLWEEMQAYNERIHTNGQAGLTTSASYQVPSFKLTDYGLADEKFGVADMWRKRLSDGFVHVRFFERLIPQIPQTVPEFITA